jgi:hypothetical protein
MVYIIWPTQATVKGTSQQIYGTQKKRNLFFSKINSILFDQVQNEIGKCPQIRIRYLAKKRHIPFNEIKAFVPETRK